MQSNRVSGAGTLRLRHAVAITVGVVIGAGIFKTPAMVAAQVPSAQWLFALWALGGVLALVGALCYAELASTYPSREGEYHFLRRAFGPEVAMLYAWARFTVITTGSIALLAYVFGDYMSQIWSLGPHSSAVYAAGVVLALTWVNWRGLHRGAEMQWWLTGLEVLGLLVVVLAACWWSGSAEPGVAMAPALAAATAAPVPTWGSLGFAMVFVLLTYGGWNDGAYISADLADPRAIAWALVISVGFITGLYLVVNWAYWQVLGLPGMAASEAVATDVLTKVFGPWGGQWIAAMVAVAALTSINATMIVGARTASGLGQDWPALRFLGHWDEQRSVPARALWIQGIGALLLVGLGLAQENGFQAMVEYTAPVFWLFFLLVGLALFWLRHTDGARHRPFRVPLYPVLPAVFCLTCAYMLWSSVGYVRHQQWGGFNAAWIGLGVLFSGMCCLLALKALSRSKAVR